MRGSDATSAAGPTMKRRPSSMTMPVSEICRAPWAFCSTTRTVRPPSRSREIVSKIWSWLPGDRPSDGSSSSNSCGLASSTIAVSRICCSPPLRLPAMTPSLAESSGKLRQHPVDRLLGGLAAQGEGAQLKVLVHGHQREVATALRHEPDAELQPLLGRQPLDRLPPEVRGAAEMAVEAVDRAQQRRLAGAVRPDDRGDAAGRDGDREIDHHRLVGVADRELVEGEDRLSHGPRARRQPCRDRPQARAGRCGSGWAAHRRSCGPGPAR